jgi:CRP/FNR family transcriptional regulator, cyclic AMP receptor protein
VCAICPSARSETRNEFGAVLANLDRMNRLQEHPFVRGLGTDYADRLADCAKEYAVPAGAFLWHQGDAANRVFFISSGIVAVGISLPRNDSFQIEVIGAGEVLGCSSVDSSHRWNFDARAITDVRGFSIDGSVIRDLCDNDGEFGYTFVHGLLQVAMRRLDAARLRILDLYQPRALPRLFLVKEQQPADRA